MINPKIKVVGVGGSGSNAISRMMRCHIQGVELIALNTDIQDLKKTRANSKLWIGRKTTEGLGSGMDPEVGRLAAEEDRERISELLKGSDMIFIAYGLGGGTGTGAGPITAEIAKETGALTVAIVTYPFSFEGMIRRNIADQGIKRLKEKVDTLISISNDKLLLTLDPNTPLSSAFWVCDDILREAVQGISDLILLPGIINVDFADIKSIMKNSGSALIGIGRARGENRAVDAALSAINSPLLDISCRGAKGVLFNISGGKDISFSEIDEAAKVICRELSSEAKVIFGAVQDEKLKKGEIKVTVIVTGF